MHVKRFTAVKVKSSRLAKERKMMIHDSVCLMFTMILVKDSCSTLATVKNSLSTGEYGSKDQILTTIKVKIHESED